ncbi:MAG: hypothetical protein AAGF95_03015 [Chloroflexota bacterium]
MCRYHAARILQHRRVAIFLLAGILTIPVSMIWGSGTLAFAQGGPDTRDPSTNPASQNATTADFISEEQAEAINNDRGLPDWAEPAADVLVAGLDLLGVDNIDKVSRLVNAGLNLTDILTGGDGIETSPAGNTPPGNEPPSAGGPVPTVHRPTGGIRPSASQIVRGIPRAVAGQ